jgi:hypothetical protein
MSSAIVGSLDMIEEFRMRRWARENYVPRGQRQNHWHRIILDEMERKDSEMLEADPVQMISSGSRF